MRSQSAGSDLTTDDISMYGGSGVMGWGPQVLTSQRFVIAAQYSGGHRQDRQEPKIERQDQGLFDVIMCSFFSSEHRNQQQLVKFPRCQCDRAQNAICCLLMRWVEREYDWRQDLQFHKLYDHYRNKPTDPEMLDDVRANLHDIASAVGLAIDNQKMVWLVEVMCCYQKHAIYYEKYDALVHDSHVCYWVLLGLAYHADLNDIESRAKRVFVFWALDIAMDSLGNLTYHHFVRIHAEALRRFGYYYGSWLQVFQAKTIPFADILWEWTNQMMFRQMGIENIGFFLDCFMKTQWEYLYKIMLSYFDMKLEKIKRNNKLMASLQMESDKTGIMRLLMDGKQEWPLIFCTAATFAYKQ